MLTRALVASGFLSFVLATVIACDPHSELPPTVPSGVGNAVSSGAQGDPPLPKEHPTAQPPEPKAPANPATKDAPKDPK